MTSRDPFDDSLEGRDHCEELSSWHQSILPENKQRRTLGAEREVSRQYRSPMNAGMATADNRHSLAPDVPERTTSKRFSVPIGGGLLSGTSPSRAPLMHTLSTNSASSGPSSPTDVPEPPLDLEDLPHVAESVLISTGEDGSYLLRDSTSNAGEFTLSVRAKNSVKHYPVRWDGREFQFGFGRFTSVDELREHFASRPVIGGESGVLTLLKFPYPRCVEEPETYDQSWLTRWFVLYKNELSYYKNREQKVAIKTIDLKDVMDG